MTPRNYKNLITIFQLNLAFPILIRGPWHYKELQHFVQGNECWWAGHIYQHINHLSPYSWNYIKLPSYKFPKKSSYSKFWLIVLWSIRDFIFVFLLLCLNLRITNNLWELDNYIIILQTQKLHLFFFFF